MQELRPEERREFQRLELAAPIPATLGDKKVTIIEMGILGARVQYEGELENAPAELRFMHGGSEIALRCEIVRTHNQVAALRFLAAMGDSGDHLRSMLASLVGTEMESRRSTPAGTFPMDHIDLDETLRPRDAGFLSYRLEGDKWTRRRIFLPEQPSAGFTVARSEDSAEMQRLCDVYSASDEEGRRLIRMFAELSISDALEIPPRMNR
jgi:hypothetical protein